MRYKNALKIGLPASRLVNGIIIAKKCKRIKEDKNIDEQNI